jgi:hypothetical protein
MAELNVAPATGEHYTTQNPQTVPTGTPGSPAQSGSVQPGTSDNLLKSEQGISLNNTALTTVKLDGDPSQIRTQKQAVSKPAAQPAHHVNAAWLVIPVIFVLVAAGMFVVMSRSAKSTTN